MKRSPHRDLKPENVTKGAGATNGGPTGPRPKVGRERLTKARLEALMREGAALRRAFRRAIEPMHRLTWEDLHSRMR